MNGKPGPIPRRRRSAVGLRPAYSGGPSAVLSILIISCCVIEGALWAADLGLWLSPDLRGAVFSIGAFYPGLTGGHSLPLFAGQPVSMFLSYAVLHGGPMHLALNMFALYIFGTIIIHRAGTARFVIAYLISTLAGALVFDLLGDGITPMVGASGALFGLLGVWSCWDYLEKRFHRAPLREIIKPLAILLIYNLAFMALMQGQIAWQAHLGGFIAGWMLALYWGRPIHRRIPRS